MVSPILSYMRIQRDRGVRRAEVGRGRGERRVGGELRGRAWFTKRFGERDSATNRAYRRGTGGAISEVGAETAEIGLVRKYSLSRIEAGTAGP